MYQMRWAIVPACLTFGPLFCVMGFAGDLELWLLGVVMTLVGLGILIHGVVTGQLPTGSNIRRQFLSGGDYLAGLVSGIGFGCMVVPGFLRELSGNWLLYAGLAIFTAGGFLRPRVEAAPKASPGNG